MRSEFEAGPVGDRADTAGGSRPDPANGDTRAGRDLPDERPGWPGGTHTPDPTDVADEAGPIGTRLGHDPTNLGDEVPAEGDLVYPTPETESPRSM